MKLKDLIKNLIGENIINGGIGVLELRYGNCVAIEFDVTTQGDLKIRHRKTREEHKLLQSTGLKGAYFYKAKPLFQYVEIYRTELALKILKLEQKRLSKVVENSNPIPVGMAAHANGFFMTLDEFDNLGKETTEKALRDLKMQASQAEKTPIEVGSVWNHVSNKGAVSSVTVKQIRTRDDGSHLINLLLNPLSAKKPRARTVCDSKVNQSKTSYELTGYAQEASCECNHCYEKYMGRQWSNNLREKLKTAILHGTKYNKYEPLLGAPRDVVIDHLMTDLRNRHPNCESLTFEDAMNGKHSVKFQIDEIIPRAEFQKSVNVNKVDEWTRVFNFKNIQLLTPENNYGKGGHVQRPEDWDVFYKILPTESARHVITESRLSWIKRRAKKGLDILEVEREFCEIYK
jgi:hypothetical protein